MTIELLLTILVLLAGFYMAWNIGANDVSNAMGTSVGSGALTLLRAVILAAVLEFAGAYFLGGNVSQTIQSGIINPEIFSKTPQILLFGMLSSLIATAIWLQIASYFGWPVSTTHAIVGALVGFGIIAGGFSSIHWAEIGAIASSWVISPIISGLLSFILFTILQRKILFAISPIEATKKILPILVFIVFIIFSLSSLSNGLGHFQLHWPLWQIIAFSLLIGLIPGIITMIIIHVLPTIRSLSYFPAYLAQQSYSLTKSLKHLHRVKLASKGTRQIQLTNIVKDLEALRKQIEAERGKQKSTSDYQVVEKMFSYLQILSAAYVAFAHGANDVANAIGPVAAALEIIRTNSICLSPSIPPWLLALGGCGIVIGLATWGWRVMETIGKKITELTPTRGFSAEIGAAITILIASKLGLPISTTHCIVGSVLGVGLAKGLSALNLRTLKDIVLSWVITIPSSAIVCIIVFYLFKAFFSFV